MVGYRDRGVPHLGRDVLSRHDDRDGAEVDHEDKCFNNYYLKHDEVSPTLTSNSDVLYLFDEYRKPNRSEVCCISTFPQDYDFMTEPYYYICGMSVPPVMMAQVASRVYDQWLSKV